MDAPPSPARPTSRTVSSLSRYASRTLQVAVGGLVLIGAASPVMWTAPAYGIAILVVPPLLGTCCRYRLDPLQRAWFSLGLAVHPIGVTYNLYGQILWYDHLAHALSASLVAALLYLVVTSRSKRTWTRNAIRSNDVGRLVHFGVLAGVLLAGVGWELLELHVSYLHVYGPEDTLADVSYDAVGWLLVAPRWRLFLRALPEGLAGRAPPDAPPALPAPSGDG